MLTNRLGIHSSVGNCRIRNKWRGARHCTTHHAPPPTRGPAGQAWKDESYCLKILPKYAGELFFLAFSCWRRALTDDLVMSYQRDDGSYATVTRSVPLEAIVEAPTLRLKPAKSKKGRR